MSQPEVMITGTPEIGTALFSTGITNPEFTRVAQSFLAGQPASKKDVLHIIMNLPKFQSGMFMGLVQDLKQLVVGKALTEQESQGVSTGGTSVEKPENFDALKMLFESRPPVIPKLSLKSAIVQVNLADPDTFRRVAGYLDKVSPDYKIVGQMGTVLEVSCNVIGNLEGVTQKLIEAVNKAYQLSFAVDKLSDVYKFIPVELPVPEPVAQSKRVDAEGYTIAETPVLVNDPGSPAF